MLRTLCIGVIDLPPLNRRLRLHVNCNAVLIGLGLKDGVGVALVEEVWKRLAVKPILRLAKGLLVLFHEKALTLVKQLSLRDRFVGWVFGKVVNRMFFGLSKPFFCSFVCFLLLGLRLAGHSFIMNVLVVKFETSFEQMLSCLHSFTLCRFQLSDFGDFVRLNKHA